MASGRFFNPSQSHDALAGRLRGGPPSPTWPMRKNQDGGIVLNVVLNEPAPHPPQGSARENDKSLERLERNASTWSVLLTFLLKERRIFFSLLVPEAIYM